MDDAGEANKKQIVAAWLYKNNIDKWCFNPIWNLDILLSV